MAEESNQGAQFRQDAEEKSQEPPYSSIDIYTQLVESEDEDLVGMIAYALYKQSKREWIREHGSTNPHTYLPTVYDLNRLRDQAKEMLIAYADFVIEQETPRIKEDARQELLFSRVDNTLTRVEDQGRWWRQLGTAIIGSLGYSLALLVLILVIRWVGIDIANLLQQATSNNGATPSGLTHPAP